MSKLPFIPRPLVRANQWTIFIFTIASWFISPWLLAVPLLVNLSGLLFNYNPIIKIGRRFLKKKPSDYIPEDVTQQKFNSVIAITCLALGLIGFTTGLPVIGYVFTIMVASASSLALLGFCVGCFIFFQLNQLRYKLKKNEVKV